MSTSLDDRLSPILVKELRQGMRARAFVISFLLLQLFLIVLVLANLAAQDNRSALNDQASYFWVIVGFALLVLMPMRGLNAIAQEVRRNTLETILLTRMTAWRLVFGKWSALFAQSLLLVSAVLPYVVLRYFIGGDDVVSDFEWLFFLLWLSAMLIAASIAASAIVNMVIRIIIVLGTLWLLVFGGSDLFDLGSSRYSFWDAVSWLALCGIFGPALLFELSASTIAPASENHAVRRRLLAVLLFLLALILQGMTSRLEPTNIMLALTVLVGICYYELSEKPKLIPRLVAPLGRFGIMGRIVGLFLLPGWPSGLLFTLVVVPLAFVVLGLYDRSTSFDGLEVPFCICAALGSVLVPILICHLFWRKMKQVFFMIVLYNIVMLGVASVAEGFAELTHSDLNQFLAFLPSFPVLFISAQNHQDKISYGPWLIANLLTILILLTILFAASRSYFRSVWALLRSAPKSP